MAYNVKKPDPAAKILRTPAPHIEAKTGGEGYGEANYSGPSSLQMKDLSQGTSRLSQNLRDSVDDPVIGKVVAGGLRGDDANQGPLAGTGIDVEERTISDSPFPAVHGAVRQQDPAAVFGSKLPSSIDKTDAPLPGKTRD